MKWLPIENITYRSALTKAEAVLRLKTGTPPMDDTIVSGFTLLKGSRGYVVAIAKDTFTMHRNITYKNSFLPEIHGRLQETDAGLEVQVSIRLPMMAMVFMMIWGLLLGFIFLSTAFTSKNLMALPLLGILLFGYAITMIGFKTESRRSKKDLQKMLEAEIVEASVH